MGAARSGDERSRSCSRRPTSPGARAFLERFDAERAAAPRVALETLIDRAVTRTGYDRHLLALPGGERRMANVRKLMRMAREFEADEGRDLRGFIDASPSATCSRSARARRRSRPRRSTPSG